MRSFEIWFTDLTEDAQERYLEFVGVDDIEDLNIDLLPIAIVDIEDSVGEEIGSVV